MISIKTRRRIVETSSNRWKLENGFNSFASKEIAEQVARTLEELEEMVESVSSMPKWMAEIFGYDVETAKVWVSFVEEAALHGIEDCVPYAWIKFKKLYTRNNKLGLWIKKQ